MELFIHVRNGLVMESRENKLQRTTCFVCKWKELAILRSGQRGNFYHVSEIFLFQLKCVQHYNLLLSIMKVNFSVKSRSYCSQLLAKRGTLDHLFCYELKSLRSYYRRLHHHRRVAETGLLITCCPLFIRRKIIFSKVLTPSTAERASSSLLRNRRLKVHMENNKFFESYRKFGLSKSKKKINYLIFF